MRTVQRTIPTGDHGARATVRQMVALSRRASSHPAVRMLAVSIMRGAYGRDAQHQASLLRNWMARSVQFLRDPNGTELLHDPVLLAQLIAADGVVHVDCDDAAMFGAALALAVGLRARFVTVGFKVPGAPYAHVWAEVAGPGTAAPWMELDTTREREQIPRAWIARTFVVNV